MNSLSIISSTVDKVIGNTPPVTPADESFRGLRRTYRSTEFHGEPTKRLQADDSQSLGGVAAHDDPTASSAVTDGEGESESEGYQRGGGDGRKGPLSIARRVYMVFVNPWLGALRWIISAMAASARWIQSFLYNEDGFFYPRMRLRRTLGMGAQRIPTRASHDQSEIAVKAANDDFEEIRSTESALDHRRARSFGGDTQHSSEDISPRRSIRIRLYNEERAGHQGKSSSLKSPTSPQTIHRITRYPKSAGPPIPLLPRNPSPKTLILDLDETLIHSLAKGGRMSSGHMVEVKLDKQHAILYYVHKRPYCDEFLRKVKPNGRQSM